MDGRSVYRHVITKFSRMGSLPHFFTHGAKLRASRARAPLLIYTEVNMYLNCLDEVSTWITVNPQKLLNLGKKITVNRQLAINP